MKNRGNSLLTSFHELKSYLQRTYRTDSIDDAFVKWYLEARFSKNPDYKIIHTGQSSDGGIDAIAHSKDEYYVFQMKYESSIRLSTISRSDLQSFEKLAILFKDKDKKADFDKWLSTVTSALRTHYIELYNFSIKNPGNTRFIFVSSKRCTYPQRGGFAEYEDSDVISSLWELYQEGFTPPTESITLKILSPLLYEDSEGRFATYVGLVNLKDFRKAMAKDKNERLFAANVRTDLRTDINSQILKTYENEPGNFWLGNNGIYIVCEDIESAGSSYTLRYPSIINGSQTLHSINRSTKDQNAMILVRILKMDVGHDHGLRSDIIRRTNTQNLMNSWNLVAQDPYQFNLARYLFSIRVFYERREKEWKNEKRNILHDFSVVNMKYMAQWLSTLYPQVGFGRARASVGELLKEANYRTLFGSFDAKLESKAYDDIAPLVWAGQFQDSIKKYFPSQKKPMAKIAVLLLVRATYDAIQSDPSLGVLLQKKIEAREFGKKSCPNKIIKLHLNFIQIFRKIQKSEQKKNERVDFSNFFKRNDLTKLAYEKVFTKNKVKEFSKLLKENLGEIY